jgi:hypothetical protein
MIENVSFGQSDSSSIEKTNDKTLNQSNPADSATVFVSFTVETTGKITNVQVSKITCKKCSKEFKEKLKSESIKTIQSMSDFEPQKERMNYTLPIKFELTD